MYISHIKVKMVEIEDSKILHNMNSPNDLG